eukprot:XP_001693014.1 predicted protein [Chlamydomonas reinhardtii]
MLAQKRTAHYVHAASSVSRQGSLSARPMHVPATYTPGYLYPTDTGSHTSPARPSCRPACVSDYLPPSGSKCRANHHSPRTYRKPSSPSSYMNWDEVRMSQPPSSASCKIVVGIHRRCDSL